MGRIIDVSELQIQLGLTGTVTDHERAVMLLSIRQAEGEIRRHLKYDPVRTTRTEYYPVQDLNASRMAVWEANDTEAYQRRYNNAVGSQLQLKHIPIRSNVSIQVFIDYDGRFGKRSGSFASETERTEGSDFWASFDQVDDNSESVCTDGILMSVGLWPTEPGSVKVIYSAGYTPSELRGESILLDATPIWSACLDEAIRRSKKIFVNQKSDTGLSFSSGPVVTESIGSYSRSVDATIASKLFGELSGLTNESKEKLEGFVHYGMVV